jgi:hypothetical protein
MHLFEFMDQAWMPGSLRATLRDILECGNSWPFRGYYDWIVREVIRAANQQGCETVVELGAGTAPITRHLLQHAEAGSLRMVVCDANPDFDVYRELERVSEGRIQPVFAPVDFAQPQQWPENSMLVLSATLHHVPPEYRGSVLNALRSSENPVLIFEPLRRTILSAFFVLLSLFPAILTPLRFATRPEYGRRFLWCWLVPVAPLMFVWDGIVSCVRQWTDAEWKAALNNERRGNTALVKSWLFCQQIMC